MSPNRDTHLAEPDLTKARPTARHGASPAQGLVLASLILGLGIGLVIAPRGIGAVAHSTFAGLFIAASLIKIATALIAQTLDAKPFTLARSDRDLPVYSILVPLYHEAEMAPQIIEALKAVSYPRSRLEVIFVVEVDDHDTRKALHAARPPRWMRVLTAIDGQPRTKPRACNLALAEARGDLVVVYDAEDRPHPDQLRESASAFAVGGPATDEGAGRITCVVRAVHINLHSVHRGISRRGTTCGTGPTGAGGTCLRRSPSPARRPAA